MKKIFLPLIVVALLSGCASSYEVRVIEGSPKEVYLTFSKGADVKVGDIFILYRTSVVHSAGGGHHGSGGGEHTVKEVAGKVQVVEIVDEQHASVKILSGRVEDGLSAEKVK